MWRGRPKAQDAVLCEGLHSHQGALWPHKCLRVPGYKQRQNSLCAFLEDLPNTMHPADQLANPALAGLSPRGRVGAPGFTPHLLHLLGARSLHAKLFTHLTTVR